MIGAPISISFMLEYGLFSAAALLIGQLSTTALAAHQIALQITAILFMVPFGISMAATVRVGHAVGRGNSAGVRRAGLIAMLIGIAFGVVLTVVVILLRFGIARTFLGEGLPHADATVALAAELLLIGGTFYITDGLQGIAAGALRGLKDTSVPLLFAAISYWGIGFCTAYVLDSYQARRARRLDRIIRGDAGLCRAAGDTISIAGHGTGQAMRVHEVTPNPDCGALLPDAQFIDAHRIDLGNTEIDARQACVRMVLHPPRWIDALIRLRNVLVSPFGLKTSGEGAPAPGGLIGLFPVVSETPERLVAGFNDYHLDFRLVVDVNAVAEGRQVTSTTLVRTHNLLGRAYLTLIMPFHKLVVRSMMRQIVKGAYDPLGD